MHRPDGNLYVSIGDKYNFDLTASNRSVAGCVLRLDKHGGVPADGGNLPAAVKPAECWAHGLRNGFRAGWDLVTQQVGRPRAAWDLGFSLHRHARGWIDAARPRWDADPAPPSAATAPPRQYIVGSVGATYEQIFVTKTGGDDFGWPYCQAGLRYPGVPSDRNCAPEVLSAAAVAAVAAAAAAAAVG